MNEFLRIFLPTYFVVYFGIAFIGKSVIVKKRIGKNPLVLPKDQSKKVVKSIEKPLIILPQNQPKIDFQNTQTKTLDKINQMLVDLKKFYLCCK